MLAITPLVAGLYTGNVFELEIQLPPIKADPCKSDGLDMASWTERGQQMARLVRGMKCLAYACWLNITEQIKYKAGRFCVNRPRNPFRKVPRGITIPAPRQGY